MKAPAIRFPRSKLYLGLAAAITLSGCGGTGQDDGSVSNSTTTFSGVAVDGHLARATVYLDSNNNATRDPWEPYAFTDNDGYYSYNPLTNTNYCRSDAPASEQIYCLVSRRDLNNVIVRIDGGYDILTGEPFAGQLSRRVDVPSGTEEVSSVVSPLTSLLTNVDQTDQQTTLLSSMGISRDDLDVDYLNTDGSGGINSGLLNKALKVHKTVTVLSDRLTDTYGSIGSEIGTPNDASSGVYSQLANHMLGSGSSLDETLEDSGTLVDIMDAAEARIRDIYEVKELTLPADMGDANNPGQFSRVTDVASRVPAVVDRLVDPSTLSLGRDEAQGGARALESLVIKTVDDGDDSSIDNAINFFTTPSNDSLIESLKTALAQDTADVSMLSKNDFTGTDFDSEFEVQDASTLPEGVTPFSQVGGMQLRVSNLDLGTANDLRDQEVEVYFDGSADDISGSFAACVKYIDGANSDGTLGEGNTRGELIDGFWSSLGASSGSDESYSLLLTVTFLGATYQTIMKPAGPDTVDGVNYDKIRFDFDGDFRAYHTEDGLTATTTIPSTNADCESRLPSRVGL